MTTQTASSLLARIRSGQPLLADGATGTFLMDRGLKPGDCPESFNLEHPGVLEEVARAYLEAGADIIGTNTFGGSPLRLEHYGLEARTEEINRRGVEAVKAVAGDRAFVMASCGPTGSILKPYGDTEPEVVLKAFRRQVSAQVAAGADAVCVETMTDLEEARLAVSAVRDVSASIPIFVTMTFDATRRGFYTIMGVTIPQAAAGLEAAGANVVGSNCGNGIEAMVAIAREFLAATRLPVMIQSNAGLPVATPTGVNYPETPEFMAQRVARLLDMGVAIVGGCCGTGPGHIRAFRDVIDRVARERATGGDRWRTRDRETR